MKATSLLLSSEDGLWLDHIVQGPILKAFGIFASEPG